METAEERLFLQETDSATANERLWHYRLKACQGDGVLRELMICHSHQCNLIETALVGATHSKLISDYFSFSHFIQASSHWAKLKHAVAQHVRSRTLVSHSSSADEQLCVQRTALYQEELTSMLMEAQKAIHRSHNAGSPDKLGSDDEPGLCRFRKDVDEFRKMWNSDLASASGVFRHHCCRVGHQDNWCCRSDEEAKDKMASTLLKALSVFFRNDHGSSLHVPVYQNS